MDWFTGAVNWLGDQLSYNKRASAHRALQRHVRSGLGPFCRPVQQAASCRIQPFMAPGKHVDICNHQTDTAWQFKPQQVRDIINI